MACTPSIPIGITDAAISSMEDNHHQWPPSSAATTIAGNDDLLTEILVRAPVNSLIRFKSVCKHWLSLISASHFSLLHTLRHPNRTPSALFLRKTPSLLSPSNSKFEFVQFNNTHNSNFSQAPFRSLNFAIKFLQSANGLLLCSSFGAKRNRSYYIYNPTTNQCTTLPPLTEAESSTVFGVTLAFDPFRSVHYKVICVCSKVKSIYHYCIDVYASEIGGWRSYGEPFTASYDMVFSDGVFWNGSVHWISPSGASLRFNVDHGCLGTMPKISGSGGWVERRYRYFGESNGHLHLIEIYGTQTTQFGVFEMERDYSKWVVKFSVDLVGIVNGFPEMVRRNFDTRFMNYYAYSILGLVRDDDEDQSSLLLHIPGKVLSYRFKDNTYKEIHNFAPVNSWNKGSLQFGCFDAYVYIETLASV